MGGKRKKKIIKGKGEEEKNPQKGSLCNNKWARGRKMSKYENK